MFYLDQNFSGTKELDLLLEEAALNGRQIQERYPEKKFFGYFCSYLPEEIILAAGMEPLRLMPPASYTPPAQLPAYCCSLAKGVLSAGLAGDYKHLAGVGFVHTCDTMQCLMGIWPQLISSQRALMLVPPVTMQAPGAEQYYYTEAENFLRALGELAVQNVTRDDLARALELCQKTRQLVQQLDELRPGLPSPLVSALLRAGQVMPRQHYLAALASALPVLQEKARNDVNRARVLVTGAVLENDGFFQMIEDLGGRVVADDTCTGYRHFMERPGAGTQEDPMKAILNRYNTMPPCPSRHLELDTRLDYLEQLAAQKKANAAVLLVRKFCEPHAWDTVPIGQRLRAKGLQVLVLELEGADVGGQERTRLQAFLENLVN